MLMVYGVINFIACINRYNTLSVNEIKKIYNKNLNSIKKNHQIIYSTLFNQREYTETRLYLTKEII